MLKCRARAVVRGRVQGVGFRAWVVDEAEALDLCGWVKNLPDGSVEALFEGAKEAVDEILKALWQGPRFALVEDVQCANEDFLGEFTGFSIIR